MSEQDFMRGEQWAYLHILQHCLSGLGYPAAADGGPSREALIAERAVTVLKLREVCRHHGDNDWRDNLHLSDIIEKHLVRHLDADSR